MEPDAVKLKKRLNFLNERIEELRRRQSKDDFAYLGGAAALDRYASGSKQADKARRRVVAFLRAQQAQVTPLIEENALLSDEWQRYKETGVLVPPSLAEAEKIRQALSESWSHAAPRPDLSLDLATLQKQLDSYQRWMRPVSIPELKVESKPRRADASAPPVFKPKASSRAGLRDDALDFESDAGKGNAWVDPVPALIRQLSSARPFERALAADELGQQGVRGKAAVPALERALSDPDGSVRAGAALALGAVDGRAPDVQSGLRRALADKNPDVRFSARTALRRLGIEP